MADLYAADRISQEEALNLGAKLREYGCPADIRMLILAENPWTGATETFPISALSREAEGVFVHFRCRDVLEDVPYAEAVPDLRDSGTRQLILDALCAARLYSGFYLGPVMRGWLVQTVDRDGHWNPRVGLTRAHALVYAWEEHVRLTERSA